MEDKVIKNHFGEWLVSSLFGWRRVLTTAGSMHVTWPAIAGQTEIVSSRHAYMLFSCTWRGQAACSLDCFILYFELQIFKI
jgi:hypothetical protein